MPLCHQGGTPPGGPSRGPPGPQNGQNEGGYTCIAQICRSKSRVLAGSSPDPHGQPWSSTQTPYLGRGIGFQDPGSRILEILVWTAILAIWRRLRVCIAQNFADDDSLQNWQNLEDSGKFSEIAGSSRNRRGKGVQGHPGNLQNRGLSESVTVCAKPAPGIVENCCAA